VNNEGIIDNSDQSDFKDKPLADVIGKELASRVMGMAEGEIEGVDLNVGGQSMIKFYDKMLPNQINKLFGKATWGKARVMISNIKFEESAHALAPLDDSS